MAASRRLRAVMVLCVALSPPAEALVAMAPSRRPALLHVRPRGSRAPEAAVTASPAEPERPVGVRELLQYLWPKQGALGAKARVTAALGLILASKLFVTRVPFIFKRGVDALALPATSISVPSAAAYMVMYGLSRAVYTLLQEMRYLVFTPVGQSALRR